MSPRGQNHLAPRTRAPFQSRKVLLSALYVMSVSYAWNKPMFHICIISTYTTIPLWAENYESPKEIISLWAIIKITWETCQIPVSALLSRMTAFWIATWKSEISIRAPSYVCPKSSLGKKLLCLVTWNPRIS